MKHPQMTEAPPRRSNRSPADTDAIAAAIVGLDRDARALETQWGVGRLLVLADDLLREKFTRQARRLNELVASAASAQDVLPHVEAMRRGWRALEAAARAAGHQPSAPEVWEVGLADGSVAAIVRTAADAGLVVASGRAVSVYTLDEIGVLLSRWPALAATKTTFPGATVTAIRPRLPAVDWERGDELPF